MSTGPGREESEPRSVEVASGTPSGAAWSVTPEAPGGAAVPADVDDELVRLTLERVRQQDGRPGKSGMWLVLSAALFAAVALLGSFDLISVALIVVVVLVHELGHYAAMRAFGYTDVRILFIPLLGAVTSGKPAKVAPWKRAVVLLAGPVPGLLLGWLLVLGGALAGADFEGRWSELVGMLLFINALNLLPVMPLDGGRLLGMAVFARHPRLEVAFAVVTASALGLLAAISGDWVVVAFAALFAYGAFSRRRAAVAAKSLREAGYEAPQRLADASDADLRPLYDAAADMTSGFVQVAREQPDRTSGVASMIANRMVAIHVRALDEPPGRGEGALVLSAYAVSWLLVVPLVLVFASAI